MGKNLIPIIASNLEVEIGEEFNVTGYEKTRFKFDKTGLLWTDECEKIWAYTDVSTFFRLINGDNEVIKLPFEPEIGDTYWTFDYDWEVRICCWHNDLMDCVSKDSNCVFRTQEDAKRARPQRYKELTGKEWEE